jgi:hypothetical protein
MAPIAPWDGTAASTVNIGDGTLDLDVTGATGDVPLGHTYGAVGVIVGLSADGDFWQYWYVADDDPGDADADHEVESVHF